MRIGYRNLADSAVLSASAQIGTKPVSLLADPHVRRRWSAGTSSAWVNLVWPSPVTLDCVALMGCSHSWEGGRCRVTASNTTGGADLYDSGDMAARVDPRFGHLIHLPPARITTTTLRLHLSDPTVPAVRGGRLFVGPLWAPSWGDKLGRRWGRKPLSRQMQGRAGQTFIDRRPSPREATITLDLTDAEVRAELAELDRLCDCGEAEDLLVITDTADPNPGEVSLWGLARSTEPPQLDQPALWSRTITVTERL